MIAGCAAGPDAAPDGAAVSAASSSLDDRADNVSAPRELLDEKTGITLIEVRRPLVLARSRSDVAANVRDYATLVAVQEDRSGKYSTWLVVHRWSTVDPRIDPAHTISSGSVLLIGDGRTIALTPAQQPPGFIDRGELLFAPPTKRDSWAYAVNLSTLRYLAAAHDISLRFVDDAQPEAYVIWEDGRRELAGMVDNAVTPAATRH